MNLTHYLFFRLFRLHFAAAVAAAAAAAVAYLLAPGARLASFEIHTLILHLRASLPVIQHLSQNCLDTLHTFSQSLLLLHLLFSVTYCRLTADLCRNY